MTLSRITDLEIIEMARSCFGESCAPRYRALRLSILEKKDAFLQHFSGQNVIDLGCGQSRSINELAALLFREFQIAGYVGIDPLLPLIEPLEPFMPADLTSCNATIKRTDALSYLLQREPNSAVIIATGSLGVVMHYYTTSRRKQEVMREYSRRLGSAIFQATVPNGVFVGDEMPDDLDEGLLQAGFTKIVGPGSDKKTWTTVFGTHGHYLFMYSKDAVL